MQALSTFENVWLQPREKLDGISLMDHLYNRLDGTYPNKFTANFRDISAIANWKDAWAEAFDDEGVTPKDVALGLKNCIRMYDWPPSLPEFLRACRPYLVPDVAFFDAVRGMEARNKGEQGVWLHPAIYHAAVALGQYEVRTQSYQQIKSRWEKAFNEQLALGQWPEIPPVLDALPAPKRTEAGKEQARKVSAIASSALASGSRNHLAWVDLVLTNPEGRCMLAINAAKKVAEERNLPIWQQFKKEESA